jgi:hypothetical protein
VDEQTHVLREALTTATRALITDLPHIAAKINAQRQATRVRAALPERVFPAVVAAALGTNPRRALPICVASALWWISADANAEDVQCGAALALRHLRTVRLPDSCKLQWYEEITRSTTSVIEARLANRGGHAGRLSRKSVLARHLGITGAAYARDAAMAAHLVDEHPVDEWRGFGALYGLLRQLHADHARSTVDEDGNPQLVVPPLLVAHVFHQGNAAVRHELTRLRREASYGGLVRHGLLREILRSPRAVDAYAQDLRGLHGKARAVLDGLQTTDEAAAVLRSAVDSVLELTMPGAREVIGA